MMRRRSLAWYRLRAVYGVLFSVFGVAIGVQLARRPEAWNVKLLGFALATVVLALGIVRIREYLHARSQQ